ncbi:hypothetical protein [Candidatus Nitrospira bockiana]
MSQHQTFWPVDSEEGGAEFLVCMSCLGEVFRRKIPMPDCPSCHGVSTYEAFTLDSIRDWGTPELIAKAEAAASEEEPAVPRSTVADTEH